MLVTTCHLEQVVSNLLWALNQKEHIGIMRVCICTLLRSRDGNDCEKCLC